MTEIKVYYADTDAGGVVYYGTYLRFLEIARTEFFQAHGQSITDLLQQGYVFVVTEVHIKYKSPAGIGDTLQVSTKLRRMTSVRVIFEHEIRNKSDNRLVAGAMVKLGCCSTSTFKPARVPLSFHSVFEQLIEPE